MNKNKILAIAGVIFMCVTAYCIGYFNGISSKTTGTKSEDNSVTSTVAKQDSEVSSESYSYDPAKGKPETNNLVWIQDVEWTLDKLKAKFGIEKWDVEKNIYRGKPTLLGASYLSVITKDDEVKMIVLTTKKQHVIPLADLFGEKNADVTFDDFLTAAKSSRHEARIGGFNGVSVSVYHWGDSQDDEYDIHVGYVLDGHEMSKIAQSTFNYKLKGPEVRTQVEHLYD